MDPLPLIQQYLTNSAAERFFNFYYQLLAYIPKPLHGAVSLFLAALILYAVWRVVKKNFWFILLLVILLPQAVPILKTLWESVYNIITFLVKRY